MPQASSLRGPVLALRSGLPFRESNGWSPNAARATARGAQSSAQASPCLALPKAFPCVALYSSIQRFSFTGVLIRSSTLWQGSCNILKAFTLCLGLTRNPNHRELSWDYIVRTGTSGGVSYPLTPLLSSLSTSSLSSSLSLSLSKCLNPSTLQPRP